MAESWIKPLGYSGTLILDPGQQMLVLFLAEGEDPRPNPPSANITVNVQNLSGDAKIMIDWHHFEEDKDKYPILSVDEKTGWTTFHDNHDVLPGERFFSGLGVHASCNGIRLRCNGVHRFIGTVSIVGNKLAP